MIQICLGKRDHIERVIGRVEGQNGTHSFCVCMKSELLKNLILLLDSESYENKKMFIDTF